MRIETEAACRTAAAAAGRAVGSSFVETSSDVPRGCYSSSTDAYFNTHAVGVGNGFAQLLCADVSTGASRSGARGCAWECTPASGAALGVWDVA